MRSRFSPQRSAHPRIHVVKQATTRCVRAEVLLGVSHPLVTVLRASLIAVEQLVAVAASEAVAVILFCERAPFGLPLAIASGLVQVALGCRLAMLASRRRDICRQLIIAGRERLALAEVERERRRLSDARLQTRLARTLEDAADAGAGRHFEPRITPLLHVHVLRPVGPQLRETARLLRGNGASVRGVALVEWLLTSGESPFYGAQLQPLRRELGRAQYLLSTHPEEAARHRHQA
jgi:hypothetical protein